jgi:NAD(P)-dependent dehydrogenase (short-subunit alcohol dehydrogenase family)
MHAKAQTRKVALVAGGIHGLSVDVVLALAAAGHEIALAYSENTGHAHPHAHPRAPDAAHELKRRVEGLGRQCMLMPGSTATKVRKTR